MPVPIDTTFFTGVSTHIDNVNNLTAVHYSDAKLVRSQPKVRNYTVKTLTAAVVVGKAIALDEIQKGVAVLAANLFYEAGGGTAAVALVVCDKNGVVLQTLKSASTVVTATNTDLCPQTNASVAIEVNYTGVLALVVSGSDLPIGWDATLRLNTIEY